MQTRKQERWAAVLLPELALERFERFKNQKQFEETPPANYSTCSDAQNIIAQATGSHSSNSLLSTTCKQEPLAVVQHTGNKRLIVNCNEIAHDIGVRSGLTLNNAYAICPSLLTIDYDETKQRQHIESLCLWATNYSSRVAPVMPDTILIEIGASLLLFGGIDRLIQKIQGDLNDQGITAAIGIAPTPEAALLLSQVYYQSGINPGYADTKDQIACLLSDIPVSALPLDEFTRKGLRQSGIKQCRQLFDLPATALSRRFGPACSELIYKLLGRIPSHYPEFQLPETFCRGIDLPLEAPDTSVLQFPINRLMHALCGYLRATESGIRTFDISLLHDKKSATRVTIRFIEANNNHQHLLRVATEKLATLTLQAPVTALQLKAVEVGPVGQSNMQLFDQNTNRSETVEQAIDVLGARIGHEQLYKPKLAQDHRPEHAWDTTRQPNPVDKTTHTRPLWLLPKPQAAPASIVIKSQAERIEYGWWDSNDVRRDYYIAQDADGRWLWVFKERRSQQVTNNESEKFMIHGLFA